MKRLKIHFFLWKSEVLILKKINSKKSNSKYCFKLSALSEKSTKIYKNTVEQLINNIPGILENRRNIMYQELGKVAISSQFAEKQILKYAFLFDAFSIHEQSEIISKLQDSINEVEEMIRNYVDKEKPDESFRDAFKLFSKLIPDEKNYINLGYLAIDNRNYLIHHCIIENPMHLYVEKEIIELTKKAIYCNALLSQIIFEADKYFNELLSRKFPLISKKYIEFSKSVYESINDLKNNHLALND